MSVSWKDSFKIGITDIDSQHRELFCRLDKLEKALNKSKGSEIVINTFHFLDNYIQLHFRAEEDLQEFYQYPHLEMHVAEHAAFKLRLKELESRLTIEDPSEKLAAHTYALLTQWLINHVTKMDTELAEYINEARTRQWKKWQVSQF